MASGTSVRADYLGGDRFEIGVGRHRVVVDQPVEAGGDDAGPTPTELFVASLAACVGHYAQRYLRRHDLPVDGLAVDGTFATSRERPARVAEIVLDVRLPAAIPEDRRAALERVIDHCMVHESIRMAPEVLERIVEPPPAAHVA